MTTGAEPVTPTGIAFDETTTVTLAASGSLLIGLVSTGRLPLPANAMANGVATEIHGVSFWADNRLFLAIGGFGDLVPEVESGIKVTCTIGSVSETLTGTGLDTSAPYTIPVSRTLRDAAVADARMTVRIQYP